MAAAVWAFTAVTAATFLFEFVLVNQSLVDHFV